MGTKAPPSETIAGMIPAVNAIYMPALPIEPNHGGAENRRRTRALPIATAQLVTYAQSMAVKDMPTYDSASRCAGYAAARMPAHLLGRVSNSPQKRIAFGGQKGANMRSESVPTRKAAWAPKK